MSSFSKVNIEVENRPKKPFSMSHPVNTTADFGSVQTIQCQYVPLGGSSVDFNTLSVVRCSPIVAPTFGSMQQHFFHSFVGVSDLYPYFNEVLGQKPVNLHPNETSIVKKFPYSNTFVLTMFLLKYTRVAVFKGGTDTYGREMPYVLQSAEEYDTHYEAFFSPMLSQQFDNGALPQIFVDNFHPLSIYNANMDDDAYLEAYTPESSDFIYKPDSAYPGTNHDPYLVCFYLTDAGKRLYKHYLGCGYKVCLNGLDAIEVSILPLLAVAKAYFDNFRIAMYDNYTTTPMYDLYQHYLRSHPSGLFVHRPSGEFDLVEYNSFLQVLAYLAETFYSEDPDYISSQIPLDGNLPAVQSTTYNSIKLTFGSSGTNTAGDRFNLTPSTNEQSPAFLSSRYNFTQLDDELLKKLYYWTNQTSQIGYQLRDLLVARGYGQYVDECRSSFIGHDVNDIIVEGVTSLADTEGAVLGEFAGRAVKRSDSQNYHYECPEIGFVITQMCIVAGVNAVVGGLNPQLLGTDPFTTYNPQLDGLGFEATPKAILGKVNQIQYANVTSHDNEVFGLSPRFSGFKTAGNSGVAMGDMLRFRFRNTYVPYYLDRLMTPQSISSQYNEQAQGYKVQYNGLPDLWSAGKAWRFPNRYQFMGNFDRIFHVFDEKYAYNQDVIEHLDNFIVHNYIDFTLWARMLPISDTFETQEEEGKVNTITTSK